MWWCASGRAGRATGCRRAVGLGAFGVPAGVGGLARCGEDARLRLVSVPTGELGTRVTTPTAPTALVALGPGGLDADGLASDEAGDATLML